MEYAKQALVGTLLGDACLVRKYKNGGTYYQFKQGDVHLSYLRHVFKLFSSIGWCNMTKPSKGTNTDAETGSPESFIIGVFQLNP